MATAGDRQEFDDGGQRMSWFRRHYPFNAEQTVNILSEFGPLVTMFVVNAAAGIDAGTWALIISTVIAMVVMKSVLGRLPVFPQIASTVTIVFGAMTLVTGDPMWVQIKVTIFNAMFAGFLFGGLATASNPMRGVSLTSMAILGAMGVAWIGYHFYLKHGGIDLALVESKLTNDSQLLTDSLCVGSMLVGFLIGNWIFRRNFFQYSFEKTFHYTREGWNNFTYSFAWFFVITAVLNEVVRQSFVDKQMYDVFGCQMNGVNIWILFKIALIMPMSGIYAWALTRVMQKHRIDDDTVAAAAAAGMRPEDYVERVAIKPRPAHAMSR